MKNKQNKANEQRRPLLWYIVNTYIEGGEGGMLGRTGRDIARIDARSRSDLLSKHMRKRIIPFVLRRLIHLEKTTVHLAASTNRRRSGRRRGPIAPNTNTTVVLDQRAALPAGAAALKDLLAPIEQHLQLRIADDAPLAVIRVLHDLDVLAFQLEQLRRHLRYRVSRLARLGSAPDGRLEFAWQEEKKTILWSARKVGREEGGCVVISEVIRNNGLNYLWR